LTMKSDGIPPKGNEAMVRGPDRLINGRTGFPAHFDVSDTE
jgi:hypothetical protein